VRQGETSESEPASTALDSARASPSSTNQFLLGLARCVLSERAHAHARCCCRISLGPTGETECRVEPESGEVRRRGKDEVVRAEGSPSVPCQ